MTDANGITIVPARTRRQRDAFVKLPFRLYRDDPYWVPPLIIAEKERLDPRKNPFFEHGVIEPFLALRGGRPVGRIAAIINGQHDVVYRDGVAFFGFFEAADGEVARRLLERVEEWARARGRKAVRGPANPSLNDTACLQIDAFDTVPYIMMPYNPPSYPEWVEAAGYAKVKDFYAWFFDINNSVNERAQRILRRIERTVGGVMRLRPLSRERFDRDAAIVRDLYIAAWRTNWGFVPPTEREFEYAAREMKKILDWDLAKILELDGEPVAFSVTLPDLNQVFKRMNGRLLPFGIFKLLFRRRYIDRSRLLLLGVKPEHRRRGLEIPLIADAIRIAEQRGWIGGECSWTLEDNTGINKGIALVGGRHYKTYRMYEKSL